jgi:hypothetical protein
VCVFGVAYTDKIDGGLWNVMLPIWKVIMNAGMLHGYSYADNTEIHTLSFVWTVHSVHENIHLATVNFKLRTTCDVKYTEKIH